MSIIAYIDHLLRNREEVIADIQNGTKTTEVTKVCFKVFLVQTVIYGLIMGAQSLLHGYPDGWLYSLTAAIKLPMLFILTLIICIPLLYVLNVLIGPREQFKVVIGILMSSLAVTSILLSACAMILLFFMMSTQSYEFITLLNVIIFSIAGLYGVWFLAQAMKTVSANMEGVNVKTIINWWLFTYAIVGTQMAWMMRPFIGMPGAPFSIFRTQESNFYITIIHLVGKMFS